MAYYYNGAKILAPLNIRSNEPVYEMTSVSLKTQRATQGAQRFELSFSVAGSAATEGELMASAITSLTSTDTMVMPQLPSVAATNTSNTTLDINATAAVGDASVTVQNNGVLSKGSFIKFSNHDKIYMVTAAVSGGSVAVSIYPTLRTALTTADYMKTGSSALLTYYRDLDNVQGINFIDGILSNQGSVSLIEAV